MGIKTSQIAAAAEASGVAGFPEFGAAIITVDSSVLVPGVFSRVVLTGSSPMPLLMPPSPTHGLLVGFAVTDESAGGGLSLNGNGKLIQPANQSPPASSFALKSGAQSGLLRFDLASDLWCFVSTAATIVQPPG